MLQLKCEPIRANFFIGNEDIVTPHLVVSLILMVLLTACNVVSPATPPASRGTPSAGSPASTRVPNQPATGPASGSPIADPSNLKLTLQPVLRGLSQPTFVTGSGDGSGLLFVLERPGRIRIIKDGSLVEQPFLDIQSLITARGQEQGLLGLVFHPQYRQNGRLFVSYSASNGDNTLAEYTVSADPLRADSASGKVLLAIPDFAANHNGGMLAFGPDGYLYFGTGDGGNAGDPRGNGQNRNALLAKILRLDVNAGSPYAVPATNPFAGQQNVRPEVWAYGLRNPWRFSFDRETGDLYIADVGQNAIEEVNFQPQGSAGGQNYGWNVTEGTECYQPAQGCDTRGITMPVAQYTHREGCSITGGYVYRGQANPAMRGVYFYGDFCSGKIWALWRDGRGIWQTKELAQQQIQISSFGQDDAGELYVLDLGGTLYRLTGQVP